jgi:apolipoprotein D and lipocalin family protein
MKYLYLILTLLIGMILVMSVVSCTATRPPIKTMDKVDLKKFMGRWYVIANIPTFIEKGAVNATETYTLNSDGSIDTIFRFRKGSATGKVKTYNPTGYVKDRTSNAVWGMQFVWPIKADYRILYVDPDYQRTIIGRIKRDYVWFMARTPEVTEAEYRSMLNTAKAQGYDISKVKKVPQIWKHKDQNADLQK